MRIFKFIGFVGIAVSSLSVNAQNTNPLGYFNDALMFSQTSTAYGSTARIQGIGNTQISLGGDISSAASNPAGLGFFNRSVFSITPSINIHNQTANYSTRNFTTSRTNFNIGNVGVVLNNSKSDFTNESFKGGTFGISFSRINDFNGEFFYQGRGGGSAIDEMIADAGTTDPDFLSEYAYSAYQNYLITPIYENGQIVEYGSDVLGLPNQTERVETYGGQSQLNLAWGGNFSDMFYVGAGLGVTSVRYGILRSYREDAYEYEDPESGEIRIDRKIQNTIYDDELEISGQGINGTFGLIARPFPVLTLGVSYTTPTYYSLEDASGFTQTTNWNNYDFIDENGDEVTLGREFYTSELVTNRYNLRTPGRVSLGGTYFLGKVGFISGDVQFVNYADSEIRSGDFVTEDDNEEINTLYRNVVNYNVGAEFRLDKFRLRGGFASFGDPYKDGDTFDESRTNISGGIGFRSPEYFVDAAVVHSMTSDLFAPYFPASQGGDVGVDKNTTSIVLTVGFNF